MSEPINEYDPTSRAAEAYTNLAKEAIRARWNLREKALGKGLEQLFNSEQINFDTIEQNTVEDSSEKRYSAITSC